MNKLILIVFFIAGFLVFPRALRAQNLESDTVQFQTSGYMDLRDSTHASISVEGQFIWCSGHQIKWVQEAGQFVYWMTITSSSTTNLPESLGETLTTDVSLDGGITGSFEVTKNESGTVIVLTLNGGTSPIYVQFAVTSIDTL